MLGAGYIDVSLVTPVVDSIKADVATMLPIGLSLFAIFAGIRIIYRFLSRAV